MGRCALPPPPSIPPACTPSRRRAGGQAGLGPCPSSHVALWSSWNLYWPSCREGLGQVGVFSLWNQLRVGLASYRRCSELI